MTVVQYARERAVSSDEGWNQLFVLLIAVVKVHANVHANSW